MKSKYIMEGLQGKPKVKLWSKNDLKITTTKKT